MNSEALGYSQFYSTNLLVHLDYRGISVQNPY